MKAGFLKKVLLLGDLFLLYFSLLLTLSLRYFDFKFPPGPEKLFFSFLLNFSILYLFWLFFLYLFDFYSIPPEESFSFLSKLFSFFIISLFFSASYFYLQPWLLVKPKTILILDLLIFSLLFSLWRFIFFRILKIKRFRIKVIFLGKDPLFKEITKDPQFSWYRLVSWKENFPKKIPSEVLVIADEKSLKNSLFSKVIPLYSFYFKIKKKIPLSLLKKKNFLFQEKKGELILKRIFDIFFSLFALISLSPFFLIIPFIIKLTSKGPIFYLQKRFGQNRKIFTLYKFRTMKVEERGKKLWREKYPQEITRFGKFLRRWELDEIPQFINILKGELSLVGPRPEWIKLAKLYEKKIPFYHLRYLVKPGLTGWAQIHFPPSTSVKLAREKFEYDLYWIFKRSLFLDLIILFKTLPLILKNNLTPPKS